LCILLGVGCSSHKKTVWTQTPTSKKAFVSSEKRWQSLLWKVQCSLLECWLKTLCLFTRMVIIIFLYTFIDTIIYIIFLKRTCISNSAKNNCLWTVLFWTKICFCIKKNYFTKKNLCITCKSEKKTRLDWSLTIV